MAEHRPKLSILLPTHNRADVLLFALESILWQTEQDFEVLIVGDGCTDNTADVVKSFDEPRFEWFDFPKGPGFGYGHRNVALKRARGQYIGFMAHDDILLPDHFALLIASLEGNQAELAYSRPLWVTRKGLIIPITYDLNDPQTLASFLTGRMAIPAMNVVHRRECFDKYGYWNAELPAGADWDMWVRIIKGGGQNNFIYVPVPTAFHFTAIWRTEAAGPRYWKIWEALGDDDRFYPSDLKIDVPARKTEQEAFWNMLCQDTEQNIKQIRRAVDQLLPTIYSALAWRSIDIWWEIKSRLLFFRRAKRPNSPDQGTTPTRSAR